MRLWLARKSAVPIREQLVTQVRLGILSRDLQPGRRLPSTRELARRFRVHANTVSSAYRQLETEGWLESRHGSGVFVRSAPPETMSAQDPALDHHIAELFHAAQRLGVPLAEVR